MKNLKIKLIYLVVFVIGIAGTAAFVSCEDESQNNLTKLQNSNLEETTSINHQDDELSTKASSGGIFDKIKKWIKAHSGTHLFENCNGTGACGPCPGLCLTLGVVDGTENDSDILSSEDYALGLRLFALCIVKDDETGKEDIYFVFNEDVRDFTIDNTFIIPEDVEASENITTIMERNSILFYEGSYSVDFDEKTGYHYTKVDSKID